MSLEPQAGLFEFAGFSLDPRQRLLFAPDGKAVPLSARAFDTLLYLVEHPNQLIDKQVLIKAIWPNVIVEENNLSQCISIVRRALGETPDEHRFVVTIPGRGFRFVSPVSRSGAIAGNAAAPTPAGPAGHPELLKSTGSTPSLPSAPPAAEMLPGAEVKPNADTTARSIGTILATPRHEVQRTSRHVTGAEATIIAILLLMVSGLLWLLVRPPEPAPTQVVAASPVAQTPGSVPSAAIRLSLASTSAPAVPAPTSGKPRIAILPLENLSPNPANAFFTDGLHEEIISTLSSRARGLEVISRTTMMTYRTPKSASAIARELGATHVLEGSVRREGTAVRLTLQLIDARTDELIWSQDYDRTLKSALTLQSEVANEVAAQLPGQITAVRGPFKPVTQDPQAYDLYLKARLDQDVSVTGLGTPLEALRRIEGLLDGALARDPQFAAAYARRAGVRALRFVYNYETDGSALRLAKQDLDTAERLAPGDPDVLWIKAFYLTQIDHDLNGGLLMYDAAETAGLTDVLWLAVKSDALLMAGRLDEAIQLTERARTLDPKNFGVAAELISALASSRRPAEALRAIDFALDEGIGQVAFKYTRAAIIWTYTGNASAQREFASLHFPAEITAASSIGAVTSQQTVLRLQHRYREMMDVLESAHTKVVRAPFSWGEYPLAEQRGWVHLLLGDRVGAARDGRELLDFVADQKETKWNRAFLHLLAGEGAMFGRERQRAIVEARRALELGQFPQDNELLTPTAAAVYAWSGAEDEATQILERLSTAPLITLSPVMIARDPLYTVPLAGYARYAALQAKLEAQMAATKLE